MDEQTQDALNQEFQKFAFQKRTPAQQPIRIQKKGQKKKHKMKIRQNSESMTHKRIGPCFDLKGSQTLHQYKKHPECQLHLGSGGTGMVRHTMVAKTMHPDQSPPTCRTEPPSGVRQNKVMTSPAKPKWTKSGKKFSKQVKIGRGTEDR